jgi:outer membrane protein TolC
LKKRVIILSLCFASFLLGDSGKVYKNLSLKEAIEITKEQNIEIAIADFDKEINELGVKIADGYNYGKLDATLMGLRSNDAGNVFGFKLQSREANFGDFGFSEFLSGVGGAIQMSGGNFAKFAQMMGDPSLAGKLLSTQPDDLNYPKDRNHFDTKLVYMIPVYTGFKLSNYKDIAQKMVKMAKYDKQKVIAEKLFQVEKAYYDISLLRRFEKSLKAISINMNELERTTKEMRREGYAKKSDLLEVQSKLANIKRMLIQTEANKELSYDFLSFLIGAKVKSIKSVPSKAPEFKISLKEALEQNLDIKKAKTGLEIQSKMVSVADAAFHPEVGAFAEYGSSDDKPFNEFFDHDRYTVGVQLSYNLFNGGSDYAKLQQEKIKRLKVLKQVELAKKGIELKFKKIKTEIRNLNAQVDSLKSEVKLSNEIFETYLAQYDEGLISINDVMVKEALQIQKLLELQQAQTKRNDKILELARLTYGENK